MNLYARSMFETTTNEAFRVFTSMQSTLNLFTKKHFKESRLKYVAQFENGKQMLGCDSFLKTIHFTI
jgi:hypothetical protein